MGYIELSTSVPNTKQLTMCFWFRVPQSSIDACVAAFNEWINADNPGPRPPMLGVIPLVMFGPKAQWQQYIPGEQPVVGVEAPSDYYQFNPSTNAYQYAYTVPGHPLSGNPSSILSTLIDIDPSYVGIDCTGDTPLISINLVMSKDDIATIEGAVLTSLNVGLDAIKHYYFGGPKDGLTDNYPITYVYSLERQSTSRPETFRLLPLGQNSDPSNTSYPLNTSKIKVTANHFHCLTVSIDFTKDCSTKGAIGTFIQTSTQETAFGPWTFSETEDLGKPEFTSAPEIFVVLDDINFTGSDLSCYWVEDSHDPNAVLSVNGYNIYSTISISGTDTTIQRGYTTQTFTIDVPQVTYSYTPSGIPFSEAPFGMPAQAVHVDSVYHVEMGIFQMFLNESRDTADEEVRRAFIKADGTPAPLKAAEDLFGKKPEVLVYGVGDWKLGKNTGTLAATSPTDGTHVGDIKAYRPKPSLNGNQGVPQ